MTETYPVAVGGLIVDLVKAVPKPGTPSPGDWAIRPWKPGPGIGGLRQADIVQAPRGE